MTFQRQTVHDRLVRSCCGKGGVSQLTLRPRAAPDVGVFTCTVPKRMGASVRTLTSRPTAPAVQGICGLGARLRALTGGGHQRSKTVVPTTPRPLFVRGGPPFALVHPVGVPGTGRKETPTVPLERHPSSGQPPGPATNRSKQGSLPGLRGLQASLSSLAANRPLRIQRRERGWPANPLVRQGGLPCQFPTLSWMGAPRIPSRARRRCL